jgi:transposase-like protein
MIHRRKFTRERKISILQELETKPMAEVCREYNLHISTVSKWKKDYEQNPRDAFKGHGRIWKEDAKTAHYERLIGRLYAEIDFLKKAYETLKQHQAEEKIRGR